MGTIYDIKDTYGPSLVFVLRVNNLQDEIIETS